MIIHRRHKNRTVIRLTCCLAGMASADELGHQQVPLTGNGSNVKKNSTFTRPVGEVRPVQPDGGWGWVVCFTSMACNGTVFGIINCFGILYTAMLDHYAKDDKNISFKTCECFPIVELSGWYQGLHCFHCFFLSLSECHFHFVIIINR